MKFTKREDYTLYLVSELAKAYPDKLISLAEISSKSGISFFFLKQLVRPLIKQKIIISREGINGGYKLSKKPENISLLDIFEAISSVPILTSCCSDKPNCIREKSCKQSFFFREINAFIIKKLKFTDLSNLI